MLNRGGGGNRRRGGGPEGARRAASCWESQARRRTLADAGRTRAVARLATAGAEAQEAATAELAALVAAAIEATAGKAPWRDLVRLAPGFAEEAAWAALARKSSRELTEVS
jgi:hypothetical protein